MISKHLASLLLLIIVSLELSLAQEEELPNVDVCEPISGECSEQGYTHTKIESSSFSDDEMLFSSQRAADSRIKSYDILTPCSKYLRLFLCAAYKPSCFEAEADTTLLIRPCRSLCNHVFTRCYPLMEKFQRKWSPELNCSRFLDDSSQRCMNDPSGYERDPAPFNAGTDRVQQQIDFLFDRVPPTTTTTTTTTTSSSTPTTILFPSVTTISSVKSKTIDELLLMRRPPPKSSNNNRRLICASSFSSQDGTMTRNMSTCAVRCDSSVEFSVGEKHAARLLTLVLDFLALAVSSIAILMFLVRRHRNRKLTANTFPTNCFIYSSVSIVGHSLAQGIGILIGVENMACEKLPAHLDDFTRLYRPLVYSPRPFDNARCSLTFLAAYYFSTSLLVRWLSIAFLWYWSVAVWPASSSASSSQRRHRCCHVTVVTTNNNDELDRSLVNYANAFALLTPIVPTCVLLVTRQVEVSELSGLCTLGSLDPDLMFKFVVFPSSLCLILGLLLILAGYRKILAMRIRNPDRESSRFVSSKRVIRRGLWSFIGSIPILIILVCQLVEYVELDYEPDSKQSAYKLTIFLVKNSMHVCHAVLVLVMTCQTQSQLSTFESGHASERTPTSQRHMHLRGGNNYDSNENTSGDTLNTSSSFERKFERSSTVDLFNHHITGMTTTKPPRTTSKHCTCREYRRLNRSLMLGSGGANRSMTLSESFMRLPPAETPVNEHHYCTPNWMTYHQASGVVNNNNMNATTATTTTTNTNSMTTARPPNLNGCKSGFEHIIVAGKLSRNMSHNAKFV